MKKPDQQRRRSAARPRAQQVEPEEQPGDRQFVTSLARGLQVLRCFTAVTPQLGAAEIARLTGLPQPTVWRLCHTLTQLGYLMPAGRSQMRPGVAALGIGYAVLAGEPIAEIARPDMEAMAHRHQGAVSLGARDGLEMVYLQRCQGSGIVLAHSVGSRVPIASSATGWAYIAGLGPQAREALYAQLAKAEGKRWPTLRSRLTAALRHYERSGYIVNKGMLNEQINAVAVPVHSPDGKQLLSLSSGGISHIFDDHKLQLVGAELKALGARLAPVLARAPRG
jgi:DNA-binding IclR family transcriptional regulator